MSTLLIIALFILMGIGLKWAAKKLGMFATELEKAAQQKEKYHEQLLSSIKNIEKELSPPAQNDKIDTRAIVEDQKRLTDKLETQRAIEEELGI